MNSNKSIILPDSCWILPTLVCTIYASFQALLLYLSSVQRHMGSVSSNVVYMLPGFKLLGFEPGSIPLLEFVITTRPIHLYWPSGYNEL